MEESDGQICVLVHDGAPANLGDTDPFDDPRFTLLGGTGLVGAPLAEKFGTTGPPPVEPAGRPEASDPLELLEHAATIITAINTPPT